MLGSPTQNPEAANKEKTIEKSGNSLKHTAFAFKISALSKTEAANPTLSARQKPIWCLFGVYDRRMQDRK
jgi:hypothetical protein